MSFAPDPRHSCRGVFEMLDRQTVETERLRNALFDVRDVMDSDDESGDDDIERWSKQLRKIDTIVREALRLDEPE